jgi:hypothetical protein
MRKKDTKKTRFFQRKQKQTPARKGNANRIEGSQMIGHTAGLKGAKALLVVTSKKERRKRAILISRGVYNRM